MIAPYGGPTEVELEAYIALLAKGESKAYVIFQAKARNFWGQKIKREQLEVWATHITHLGQKAYLLEGYVSFLNTKEVRVDRKVTITYSIFSGQGTIKFLN